MTSDIVERLHLLQSGAAWYCEETAATLEDAADEIGRLRLGYTTLNSEVCQRLGKALGYPWFKDDQENFPGATEESGVCTGEHVAESIAAEAARRIGNLEAELDEAIQCGYDWCDQAKKARAERDAAVMDADMQAREAGNMEHNARVLMAERDRLREAQAAIHALSQRPQGGWLPGEHFQALNKIAALAAPKETGHE